MSSVEIFTQHAKYYGITMSEYLLYGKCHKISYTKVSDKMAHTNRTDPDQTASEEAVWSGSILFAILVSILRNNCLKSKI